MAPDRVASDATRVLLVDDEMSGAEVLAHILAGEGFDVTTAPDARQALALLREAAPELVVTDFMMPGMNGAELVHAIRALPGYETVPVLMMSGAPESALRHYQPKYQAFLRKPFGLDQFLAVVRRLLESPQS